MHRWLIINTSLFLALVLTILPMPEVAMWYRPAWVLLVLIYWNMTMPSHVGIGLAWFMGIMMDLLSGTLLGEHALAFTVVIYCVLKMVLRFRMYPLLQQSLWIFMFIGLYQFVIYCTQGFIHELPHSYLYWLPSLTSALLWPWLFVLMRDCCHWLRMA